MTWVTSQQACEYYGIAPRTLRNRAAAGTVKRRGTGGMGRYHEYWIPDGDYSEDQGETDAVPEIPQPTIETIAAPSFWSTEAEITSFEDDKTRPQHHKMTLCTETCVSLYDVHVPDHDVKAVAVVLQYLEDTQPEHLVIGGDFLELESCSSHGGIASPKMFVDEIEAGRALLEKIRGILPNSTIVYLEGNHEDRLRRSTISNMPGLHKAVSVPSALELHTLDIEWKPYKQLHRLTLSSGALSEMRYTHGSWHSQNHAAQAIRKYQVPLRYGHTHRPQLHSQQRIDGFLIHACGTGCLRTLQPEFMGMPSGWCHGIGVDEYAPDGTVWPRNVQVVGGRIVDGGRIWQYGE